jgi:hypothetical protein
MHFAAGLMRLAVEDPEIHKLPEPSIGEWLLRGVEVCRDCVDIAFIERTGQIGHAR